MYIKQAPNDNFNKILTRNSYFKAVLCVKSYFLIRIYSFIYYHEKIRPATLKRKKKKQHLEEDNNPGPDQNNKEDHNKRTGTKNQ
jgi:hypothetical protein